MVRLEQLMLTRTMNKNGFLNIIIALIVFAVIAGGGVYFVVKNQNQESKLTFSDAEAGISFEYPSPNQCSVSKTRLSNQSDLVFDLGRIQLEVSKGDRSLDQYIKDRFFNNPDFTSVTSENTHLGGETGAKIEYRLRFSNAYGTATVAIHKDSLYVIGFTGGAFNCDELNAYDSIVKSFRFDS